MSLEIERKFLINGSKLPGCLKPISITQGYLNDDPERTVRVRRHGDKAFITIKGKSSDDGLSRFEWESEIDIDAMVSLMWLCTSVVSKNRYHMIHQGKLWEIDVFLGANTGLVVAEIELTSETESFNLPPWVTEEVTGDPKYYNSNLATKPYMSW